MNHVYYTGFCSSMHPHNEELIHTYGDGTPESLHPARAAFLNGVEWPQNYTIKIAFVRDANYSKEKADWVQKVITDKILPIVNLKFQWDVDPEESDVRITFDQSQGAYSVLGTQAQNIPKNQNTMNLGWLDKDQSNSDFPEAIGTGAVIVHEFGHMLGLIHEHSRAAADVPFKWCEPCVIQYLGGPPNNWSPEQVKQQVLTPYEQDQYNGSVYDKNSIMHYYFPSNFFSPPYNLPHTVALSDLDTIWINKKYPGKKLPKGLSGGGNPDSGGGSGSGNGTDGGSPDSGTGKGKKSWFKKYWWVLLVWLLVIIAFILKFGYNLI